METGHRIDVVAVTYNRLALLQKNIDCLRHNGPVDRVLYVPDAAMDKHQFFTDDTWTQRQRKKLWKRYYQVRNSTYMNHHYGTTWTVRYVRGWMGMIGYVFTILFTMPQLWSTIPGFFRAYRDGVRESLGKM